MSAWAVVVAAGRGQRFGGEVNKVYAQLAGRSVLSRSLDALERSGAFDGIVVVCAPGEEGRANDAARFVRLPVLYVQGGARRQDSVLRGLEALPDDCEVVAVHDGARPLASPAMIAECVESARGCGSGVAASPVRDTVKLVAEGETVRATPPRASLRAVKTPQCFRMPQLLACYRRAQAEGWDTTDDAGVAELCGVPVRLVPCGEDNIKITEPEDIRVAEALLNTRRVRRVGTGFDVHALVPGRKLILCGVTIPHETGLEGHSDADAAAHAVIDALLGACALGDIGMLYPDTQERWRGADSMLLLRDTAGRVREAGFAPDNIDVTVIAQRPKLSPYREAMRSALAHALSMPISAVSVKMKTAERLGFIGREEGIVAQAIATVTGVEEGYTA